MSRKLPKFISQSSDITETTGAQIGSGLRQLFARNQNIQIGAFVVLVLWLMFYDPVDLWPVLKIAIGSFVILGVWQRNRKPGFPIILIVALQSLLVYATPLLTDNESIREYSSAAHSSAATEIMIYGLALAIGWKMGVNRRDPKSIDSWNYSFVEGKGNEGKLARFSLLLLTGTLGFVLGLRTELGAQLVDSLPSGSNSILRTLSDATTMGGGLLGAFVLGTGRMTQFQRGGYWVLFTLLYLFMVSDFLLSNATGLVCATTLGLLIGKRQVPFGFLVLASCVSFFLNLTKFEMRNTYWNNQTEGVAVTLEDTTDRLLEWVDLSFIALFEPEKDETETEGQLLADRVNNLSIFLYVQDAVQSRGMQTLSGETYQLVPKLLIPRILWSAKPRAHVGQELLNVHFERQTIEETYKTYIAWGLLAEAYGNFGPIVGALIFGVAFGYVLGLVEALSRPYSLKTLQCFLFLAVMVRVGTSFEMVSSVFVTSTFQQLVAITGVSYFLVNRRHESYSPNGLSTGTNRRI